MSLYYGWIEFCEKHNKHAICTINPWLYSIFVQFAAMSMYNPLHNGFLFLVRCVQYKIAMLPIDVKSHSVETVATSFELQCVQLNS